ncbi:MAG: hypothetical protein ACR2OM_00720 [Aestuariivirgaceae bacterium]
MNYNAASNLASARNANLRALDFGGGGGSGSGGGGEGGGGEGGGGEGGGGEGGSN